MLLKMQEKNANILLVICPFRDTEDSKRVNREEGSNVTTDELYSLGQKAFDQDRYEEALRYFTKAADDHPDVWFYMPLCYLNYASDVSLKASASKDTEAIVRGQQHAVALLDAGVRAGLYLLKNHCNSISDGNAACSVIAQCLNLQYVLVATGLTTAYRLTRTTTTVERTKLGDITLWEDVVGTDTEQFVSLTSYDLHDYHIFGPDEKTKRVDQEKKKVLNNAVQVATMLEYLDRPYDAHMVRAAVACAMADSENGDRRNLLPADWFLCRAQELAERAMSSEVYDEWKTLHSATFEEFTELETKYAALVRGFIREDKKLFLEKFFMPDEPVPHPADCDAYVAKMEEKTVAAKASGANDMWEVFLSVFAQAATTNMIGPIVFSSVISLFMGGLLSIFGPDANGFSTTLIVVWMIITLVITYIRSITDSSGVTGNAFRLYQAIMIGTAIVFSINFWLGIIALVVLKYLSAKYK